MKRTILCVAAAALGAASGMAVAAGSVASPKPKATGAAANPACALVTKAEAEAILGHPLDELASGSGDSCHYGHKPDKPFIFMTELRAGQTKATFEAETKNVAKVMRKAIKPVTGYGEQAVWIGDFQIIVLQHGKAFSVAQPAGKVPPAKLDAFLRKALSRI